LTRTGHAVIDTCPALTPPGAPPVPRPRAVCRRGGRRM